MSSVFAPRPNSFYLFFYEDSNGQKIESKIRDFILNSSIKSIQRNLFLNSKIKKKCTFIEFDSLFSLNCCKNQLNSLLPNISIHVYDPSITAKVVYSDNIDKNTNSMLDEDENNYDFQEFIENRSKKQSNIPSNIQSSCNIYPLNKGSLATAPIHSQRITYNQLTLPIRNKQDSIESRNVTPKKILFSPKPDTFYIYFTDMSTPIGQCHPMRVPSNTYLGINNITDQQLYFYLPENTSAQNRPHIFLGFSTFKAARKAQLSLCKHKISASLYSGNPRTFDIFKPNPKLYYFYIVENDKFALYKRGVISKKTRQFGADNVYESQRHYYLPTDTKNSKPKTFIGFKTFYLMKINLEALRKMGLKPYEYEGNPKHNSCIFCPKSYLFYFYIYEKDSDKYFNQGMIITNQTSMFGINNITEIQKYFNLPNDTMESAPKTFFGFRTYSIMLKNKKYLQSQNLFVQEYEGNPKIPNCIFKPKSNLFYIYFIESDSEQHYGDGKVITNKPNIFGCKNVIETQQYYYLPNESSESTPKTFLGFQSYEQMIYNKDILSLNKFNIYEYNGNPKVQIRVFNPKTNLYYLYIDQVRFCFELQSFPLSTSLISEKQDYCKFENEDEDAHFKLFIGMQNYNSLQVMISFLHRFGISTNLYKDNLLSCIFDPQPNLFYLYFIEPEANKYFNNGIIITNENRKFGVKNIVEIQRYFHFKNDEINSSPKTFLGFQTYQDLNFSLSRLQKSGYNPTIYSDNPPYNIFSPDPNLFYFYFTEPQAQSDFTPRTFRNRKQLFGARNIDEVQRYFYLPYESQCSTPKTFFGFRNQNSMYNNMNKVASTGLNVYLYNSPDDEYNDEYDDEYIDEYDDEFFDDYVRYDDF